MTKKEEDLKSPFNWKEDDLPLIYAAIADRNYFKRKMLFFVIYVGGNNDETDNDILIGFIFFSLIF